MLSSVAPRGGGRSPAMLLGQTCVGTLELRRFPGEPGIEGLQIHAGHVPADPCECGFVRAGLPAATVHRGTPVSPPAWAPPGTGHSASGWWGQVSVGCSWAFVLCLCFSLVLSLENGPSVALDAACAQERKMLSWVQGLVRTGRL